MALDGDNDNLEYDFLNAMPDHGSFVYFHSEPSFQHAAEGSKPMSYPPFVSYQNAYPMRNPEDVQVPGYLPQSQPPFANFGTYDPFQGSPLEISNFSFLERREPVEGEPVPAVQPVHVAEPAVEPVAQRAEPVEEVQSKRSYKDVLTIPPSPTLQPKSGANVKQEEDPVVDLAKPKAASVKTEAPSGTPKHSAKTGLNNYRAQVNANPRKPLKINNNLSAASGSVKKANVRVEEKNLHASNESVRSVPSQTDFVAPKRKPPSALIRGLSFEEPPSDDEKKQCVTSRIKDRKKNEKNKPKVRESHHDRSTTRKPAKKTPSSNQGPLCTKTYVQKVETYTSTTTAHN